MELGIIEKHCGWHRGRSTMYTVGTRMAKYVDVSFSISVFKKEQQLPADWEQVFDETIISIEEQVAAV